MKSEFFRRAGFLSGVIALLFSASAAAQEIEPTRVKDGVNCEQYSKFLAKPLNVDDVKVLRPPWAKDVFSGNGGYPLVSADGKVVLEVEVELLSIMPWVRPGGEENLDGYQVKTLGSGEIAARVELRDSTTRELLLMIEGDKGRRREVQGVCAPEQRGRCAVHVHAFRWRLFFDLAHAPGVPISDNAPFQSLTDALT